MNKKRSWLLILVVFFVACAIVGLITGILTGEIDVIQWVLDHKILLSIAVAYILLKYVVPKKVGSD